MKKISTLNSPSKEDIASSLNPSPSKISYKYLQRTLHFNLGDDQRKFKCITTKRIHIRSLVEEDAGDNFEMMHFSTKSKVILKKKLFKGLKSAQMSSFFRFNWIQELKHSKNLIQFRCRPNFRCPHQNVVRYLQKINKNLEKVNIYIDPEGLMPPGKLRKLYKAVGRLYQLKSYEGERSLHGLESNDAYFEFLGLNQSLKRLPKLENFECNISELGLNGLWKITSREGVYEKVTKLYISLEIFKPEEEDKRALTFLHFQAFPNLKELQIQGQSRRCSYGPFVIEGFKSLVHLEKLSLQISSCPEGNFIFEGFLHLPQLSSFSFDYTHIINLCSWENLIRFLQQQANLVLLNFSINLELADNQQAQEDFFAALSNKPKLQYLTLKTNALPFNIISNGLKRMIGTDQLKSLHLQALHKRFSSCQSILPSFQGFNDFLLRNRNTLSELKLDFPLFEQRHFNDAFGSALSQLTQLKVFSLDLSVSSLISRSPSGQWTYLNKVLSKEGYEELWNLLLNDILPQLGKLEDLTLKFDGLEECPSELRKSMTNCFRALPLLKNLRHLRFSVPQSGLSSAELESIKSVLKQLRLLLSIQFLNLDVNTDDLEQIESHVAELQSQQSLRINLSF